MIIQDLNTVWEALEPIAETDRIQYDEICAAMARIMEALEVEHSDL